ncbi:MAG: TIM barrel protein [Eubacteriales bacterium]|nr:TIM barrel protein [Eubacteriales bacterium]
MRLGVSLFSFSSEYYQRKMTLHDMLASVRNSGGEAIEIVASQMMPGFPYPDRKWLHALRDECESMGLDPFCYSAHLDSGLRADRFMTDEEKVRSTVNDIRSAYEMGASVVRTQFSISPALLYSIAPQAERYGVKVGVEIHPPHRLDTPLWIEFEKVFRTLDTPYIGMVLDTGIYQEYPYDGWLNVYAQHGVRSETIAQLLEALRLRQPLESVKARLQSEGASPYALEMADEIFALYRPYQPDELPSLLKYVTHFHTKFYHMENGEEKTIPYAKILNLAKENHYDGYLISEYEGHYCYDCKLYPAADQVREHIAMEKRLLG